MTQVDAPYRLYEQPSNAFIASFVGKTNLLGGTWRRAGEAGAVDLMACWLEALDADFPAERPSPCRSARRRSCCARPATAGSTATSRAASSSGSQWLFTVDTRVGDLTVRAPIRGEEPPAEARTSAWIGSPPICA